MQKIKVSLDIGTDREVRMDIIEVPAKATKKELDAAAEEWAAKFVSVAWEPVEPDKE